VIFEIVIPKNALGFVRGGLCDEVSECQRIGFPYDFRTAGRI
jgi:hypothetical protein